MADKRDYYEILGVSKTATADEIKSAFRKKAKECHPDLNPGDKAKEAQFKELNEAAEVLMDADKRAKYDQYGHAAFDPSMGGQDPFAGGFGDLGDILGQMFGGGFGGFGGFGGGRSLIVKMRRSSGAGCSPGNCRKSPGRNGHGPMTWKTSRCFLCWVDCAWRWAVPRVSRAGYLACLPWPDWRTR